MQIESHPMEAPMTPVPRKLGASKRMLGAHPIRMLRISSAGARQVLVSHGACPPWVGGRFPRRSNSRFPSLADATVRSASLPRTDICWPSPWQSSTKGTPTNSAPRKPWEIGRALIGFATFGDRAARGGHVEESPPHVGAELSSGRPDADLVCRRPILGHGALKTLLLLAKLTNVAWKGFAPDRSAPDSTMHRRPQHRILSDSSTFFTHGSWTTCCPACGLTHVLPRAHEANPWGLDLGGWTQARPSNGVDDPPRKREAPGTGRLRPLSSVRSQPHGLAACGRLLPRGSPFVSPVGSGPKTWTVRRGSQPAGSRQSWIGQRLPEKG